MNWQKLTGQLREYFTFTRKERNGVFILSILLLTMQCIIMYLHYWNPDVQQADISSFKKDIDAFMAKQPTFSNDDKYISDEKEKSAITAVELFAFNPNLISEEDWKKLGVKEKAIHSIKNYLSKGGHFYKKEDLKKIYNLPESDYLRLEPYIILEQPVYAHEGKKKDAKKPLIVELNTATEEQLMTLPTIGEKRAQQIIKYRSRLGGFIKKEQLKEVYAVTDSVYDAVSPFITINMGSVIKIPVNTIASDTFYHPYLKKNLLKMIINYRTQHGPYTDKITLKKLPLMTDSIYDKLEGYIDIE